MQTTETQPGPATDAGRRFVVRLPLPPRECSPNFHGAWRQKAKVAKKYRADCCMAVLAARVPALRTPVVVHLEFYLCRRPWDRVSGIPTDQDNATASAKQAMDSLRDAGVVPDDSYGYVRISETKLYRTHDEHKGESALVMTLEEAN